MTTSNVVSHFTAAHGKLLLVMSLDPKEIGRRIKSARDLKGWTQMDLALRANVSMSTVTRWEAGKLPPVRELVRLAAILEVEPDYLVEGEAVSDQTTQDANVWRRLDAIEGKLDALLRRGDAESG